MNVRELFSNISGTYDLLNRVLSFGADQRWRKQGVSLLPHGAGVRVLDLACGTLDMSLQYLRQGEGEVYAADFALPMLLTGRMKASPTLDPRLHLVCTDGTRLPFPSRFFDAVMCAWGVRNFSNLPGGLKEIRRILKPNGSVLILEFFRPAKTFSKIFSKTYGRHVIPRLGKWLSKDGGAYDYLHRSVQGFYSLEEYQGVLKDSGFDIQIAKDLTGGISSLVLANLNGMSE
ncbi:MAG: ubiquinone/menaquinone biosynthesis methyltransferase [Deltaproteobacteria bacterium]|nr:ubiquinone/menaquinone biosynthesis methyltransferase [Deltaproteobacteria bacterium]